MSKKHFIALADAIKEHNTKGDHVNPFTQDQLEALARFCHSQNSDFKAARWRDYISGECGKNGGAIKKAS